MTTASIILFGILAFAVFEYGTAAYLNARISKVKFFFLLAFALILALLAVSCLGYENYKHFGFMHIMLTLAAFCCPFALKIFFPDKDKNKTAHKIIMYTLTAFILLFTIYKFFYIIFLDATLYQVLPLNVCNIAAVFIIARPFIKSKALDNYILCFGFLGGILNILIGTCYGGNFFFGNFFKDTFFENSRYFFGNIFESNMVHNLLIVYSLYALLSKEIVPDVKTSLKNLYWLVPIYIVFIFTNQIYEFNFFFTGAYDNPVIFLYDMFPTFDLTLFGFRFEINLLYNLVSVGISVLILYLTILIFSKFFRPEAPENDKKTA
jgi:hypothetical protein